MSLNELPWYSNKHLVGLPAAMVADKRLSNTALQLALVLQTYAEVPRKDYKKTNKYVASQKEGDITPSIASLINAVDWCKTSVKTHLRKLRAAGWITWEGRSYQTNRYTLLTPQLGSLHDLKNYKIFSINIWPVSFEIPEPTTREEVRKFFKRRDRIRKEHGKEVHRKGNHLTPSQIKDLERRLYEEFGL